MLFLVPSQENERRDVGARFSLSSLRGSSIVFLPSGTRISVNWKTALASTVGVRVPAKKERWNVGMCGGQTTRSQFLPDKSSEGQKSAQRQWMIPKRLVPCPPRVPFWNPFLYLTGSCCTHRARRAARYVGALLGVRQRSGRGVQRGASSFPGPCLLWPGGALRACGCHPQGTPRQPRTCLFPSLFYSLFATLRATDQLRSSPRTPPILSEKARIGC